MRTPTAADLPRHDELQSMSSQDLLADNPLERAIIADADIDFESPAPLRLQAEQSVIERISLIGVVFEQCNLIDCVIRQSDLSGTDCSRADWSRVEVVNCRLAGIDISQGSLRDVTFRGCKLDMANFRSAVLMRVHFTDCTFIEADFQGAKLTDVQFSSCHIEKAAFDHCTLKDVDARSSTLTSVQGWTSLRGLTLDPLQVTTAAPELAQALGLRIGK